MYILVITIKFEYSKHALEKIDALGIEKNVVEKTIVNGMKWKETDNEKWHANMAGVECVFLKSGDSIFIITIYENGGKK